jgi:aminoglycoside phosphotransferase (APT) family kinase protein
MDAMRRNMIARHDAHGQEQTVLLDWGEAGLGAPGEDLAAFITGSVFLDAETPYAREMEDIALESYIDGLRDVGWRGDADHVRRGYAIAAALRVLGGTTWVLHTLLNDSRHGELERAFGRPIHELADRWAGAMRVAVEALDRARD